LAPRSASCHNCYIFWRRNGHGKLGQKTLLSARIPQPPTQVPQVDTMLCPSGHAWRPAPRPGKWKTSHFCPPKRPHCHWPFVIKRLVNVVIATIATGGTVKIGETGGGEPADFYHTRERLTAAVDASGEPKPAVTDFAFRENLRASSRIFIGAVNVGLLVLLTRMTVSRWAVFPASARSPVPVKCPPLLVNARERIGCALLE
jgi:hypothetical protein